jgi:hypothetical protein
MRAVFRNRALLKYVVLWGSYEAEREGRAFGAARRAGNLYLVFQ